MKPVHRVRVQTRSAVAAALALGAAAACLVQTVLAQPQAGPQTGIVFRNTVTGEILDTAAGKEGGRDSQAVKTFFQTGQNLYLEDKSCLRNGESLFATSCSGCHGHLAEGKLGPGLNDNYWTYPANAEDTGLFATLWGGANGMMGPHNENLNPDEMLQVITWVRHLYTGPARDAVWLNADQKKQYRPFKEGEHFAKDAPGQCKPLE